MSAPPPLPGFAAVIVAAGRGLRAGHSVPKQFVQWRGKPLVRHSVDALLDMGANPVIVVAPADCGEAASSALEKAVGVTLVSGDETRQGSVRKGLEAMADDPPARVLIHDAARPDIPAAVVDRLLSALEVADGAIPVLGLVDSIVSERNGMLAAPMDRDQLRRVQTPQAFKYSAILEAHRSWKGEPTAGDDAQVMQASQGRVALVDGDERLTKLTFANDFAPPVPAVRTGFGYDVHRLATGEELWLAGVKLNHHMGLQGHSDADVALHALVDALLGAIGEGDIGSHFPPSDPQWRGADSGQFVHHAAKLVASAGYAVANIDVTIICEAPKIGPHRDAMRASIAALLGVDLMQVSVKATTTERLGFTGRGEGIAAQAVATLVRY